MLRVQLELGAWSVGIGLALYCLVRVVASGDFCLDVHCLVRVAAFVWLCAAWYGWQLSSGCALLGVFFVADGACRPSKSPVVG